MERKEAIEVIKELQPNDRLREALRTLIPELRESEDERIIDGLHTLLKGIRRDGGLTLNKVPLDKCEEWLEKQKEQKPVQDEEEKEYVHTLKSRIADFLHGKDEIDRGYYQKIYDWLDGRHIEQKPAEIDEYKIIKKHITEDSLSSEVNKRLKECGWYVTYEKPAEWSEEEYDYYDAIIAKLEVTQNDAMLTDEQMSFLKSMPERFNFPPKQEWSERDKKIILSLHHALNGADAQFAIARDGLQVGDVDSWLEHLHSSWKPSEEQMDALDSAINYLTEHTCTPGNPLLISLHHDLQKLL